MTAAMIVLAVLLAVVLLALGLFLFACRRSPVPDFTKPAVIAQWGREDQTEEILAGITLMQDAEDIFLPSYDGLRLHGQLLQQPGAKGTITVTGFSGYAACAVAMIVKLANAAIHFSFMLEPPECSPALSGFGRGGVGTGAPRPLSEFRDAAPPRPAPASTGVPAR